MKLCEPVGYETAPHVTKCCVFVKKLHAHYVGA
ncbi:hypothetical protein T4A_11765 [Trichinella pseudospiralis]|uniref:Uncharacterized protein n=1 Tax=Trichinella pseudospiralis TaxID=6337 RepID=A0A0V1BFD3_TRIPS|nr:hypothetical protein T4A_11765 [Trichinella pseudospiralis]